MDQPQNPLVEGKRGTSTHTTPMLAASANLEQELSAKTASDPRAATDLPKADLLQAAAQSLKRRFGEEQRGVGALRRPDKDTKDSD